MSQDYLDFQDISSKLTTDFMEKTNINLKTKDIKYIFSQLD
jgi:hypothetical protein